MNTPKERIGNAVNQVIEAHNKLNRCIANNGRKLTNSDKTKIIEAVRHAVIKTINEVENPEGDFKL